MLYDVGPKRHSKSMMFMENNKTTYVTAQSKYKHQFADGSRKLSTKLHVDGVRSRIVYTDGWNFISSWRYYHLYLKTAEPYFMSLSTYSLNELTEFI